MTIHKRIPAEDYELLKKEYRSKEELQAMIVEAILKEEDEIRKESEARGETKGKLLSQRQTLLRLLAKRFPETLEQTEKFTAYFDQISDFEALIDLIDDLLIAPTLAAFEEALKPLLPKDEEQK